MPRETSSTRHPNRCLAALSAAVVAALAVPAIALSGRPADPGLRDYIGRILLLGRGSAFATPPRYVAGVRTTRGLVLLWAAPARTARSAQESRRHSATPTSSA